jgi:hypothetical protein
MLAARHMRPSQKLWRLSALAGVVVALGAAVAWLLESRPVLTDDFIAYWSAARLLAHGINPYEPNELLRVQESVGWPHGAPLPTWYGPWILATAVPLGLLPYWPARIAWIFLQVASFLVACELLSLIYREASRKQIVFLLLTFAPAVMCLVEGQVTPFILLGVVGFLWYSHRGNDWRAGAALFPLTAKPLLLYLVWMALVHRAFRSRRFGAVAGASAMVAAGSLVAVIFNGGVFRDWLQFSAARSPLRQAYTPTAGSVLRYAFGADHFWLAYLALGVGLVWWVRYQSRVASEWRHQIPTLSLASFFSTPFAWTFDALVLFPRIVQAAPFGRRDLAVWLLLNALAIGLYPFLRYDQTWYLLYFVGLLLWGMPKQSPNARGAESESMGDLQLASER